MTNEDFTMTDHDPNAVGPDLPQGAGTDPAQPSGTAAARRAHRFLVPTLLVLATVIGIAGAFAVWVRRYTTSEGSEPKPRPAQQRPPNPRPVPPPVRRGWHRPRVLPAAGPSIPSSD